MSSVVISGDSSEGAASQVTGGEGNPIELDDSSTDDDSNSENDDAGNDNGTSQVVKKEKKHSDDENESGDDADNESSDNGSEDGSDQESSEGDDDDEMNVSADADGTEAMAADTTKSETESKRCDSDDDAGNDNDDGSKCDSNNNLATKTVRKRKKHLYGNIESMSEIIKSPYEGNECAEVGEDCFEEFQALMVDCSESNKDGSAVNPRMVALVGDKLARDLFNAHHEIGKSGMLYSANWKEGKIRDSDFGWIPKRQLLLCLHEHRFAKGSSVVLHTITKNLDCTKLVLEAMKLWDLVDAYPNLASNQNEESLPFTGMQRVFCYKCEIFVARAFATLQILNKTEGIQQSLTKKIRACLAIMDKHVRPNQIELARIRKKLKKRKDIQSLCSDDDSDDESDDESEDEQNVDDEESSVESKIEGKGNRSEHTGSRRSRVASSSGGSKQRVSKPRVPKSRSRKPASKGGRQTRAPKPSDRISPDIPHTKRARKRRRKVPKREEREESMFMMWNTMQMQMQRLNQMMSFFHSQLQDHRNSLREEVREKLIKDGYEKR